MTLQGSYHAFRTTLATHEDPPHFLAEGCFGSNQTLTVEAWMPLSLPSDLENDGEAEAYRLTVEDYAEPLLVRYGAQVRAGYIVRAAADGWRFPQRRTAAILCLLWKTVPVLFMCRNRARIRWSSWAVRLRVLCC